MARLPIQIQGSVPGIMYAPALVPLTGIVVIRQIRSPLGDGVSSSFSPSTTGPLRHFLTASLTRRSILPRWSCSFASVSAPLFWVGM